ncbi:MAG TPA: 5-histidylcysteine sulfoxide synthase [Candidatus Cloacimonadota bacterium]|nr:5-histidylcysteine sulfoxide synthase [Candidatus Cloacimonadota bacterium]
MEAIKGIRTLNLKEPDPALLRERVRHYFHQTYTIEERLYEQLIGDDTFYLRADPLRHPLVFYLGHTAVFYVNKLNIGKVISQRINPRFESMFAVGVDEMSWDDLNESHYDWPPIPEVRAYRDEVRALVDNLISTLPLDEKGIEWDSPWWAIVMGIEHERIHLETSSVLIRQLPLERLKQLDFWAPCELPGTAPDNELLPVRGGKVVLGKDDQDPWYGWDNEYGHAAYEVEDFSASKYLVSNAEFLKFVQAGGYEKQRWWTPEGWSWKSYKNAGHPQFWINDKGVWKLRLVASVIPLPWNWPVEVNYLEAKAFCNWMTELTGKPIRLPMEEEWYRLRDLCIDTDQPLWDKAPGNINLEAYNSSCPVDIYENKGFYDVIGNVWQWTETPIYAYPGFKIHPIYDDFSVPTFDGRHNLIKGGSWISTGNEALRNSRYAFRRHFMQHAGFRYIQSEAPVVEHGDFYENDAGIINWCDASWGEPPLGDKHYSLRLIEGLRGLEFTGGKALHIGCKTGRGTFELARHFDSVVGLDFTARLIRMATDMKEKGYIRYLRNDEGQNQSYIESRLESFELSAEAAKVEFWQADPSNLIARFDGYDFILAENVLAEAINPGRFLKEVISRLVPGGVLAIADHYERSDGQALGGFRKDGEPFSHLEGLTEALTGTMAPLQGPIDVWQPLRSSERSYKYRKLQLTLWRKL